MTDQQTHDFDSSWTCNYCGITQERSKPGEPCPKRQQTQRYRPLAPNEMTKTGDEIERVPGVWRTVMRGGDYVGNRYRHRRPIPETSWRDPVGDAGYPYPPGTVVEFPSSCSGGSISQWLIGRNGYWERLDAKTAWRGPCGQQCKHRVIDYRPDLVTQQTAADETQTDLSSTDETQDLLPCPFCGRGKIDLESLRLKSHDGDETQVVHCRECGCYGPPSYYDAGNHEHYWNQRPRSESAELTRLRAEVERLKQSNSNWERLSFASAHTADAARDEIERLRAELAKYKPSEIKAIDLTETTVFVGAAWGAKAGQIQ